MYVNRKLKEAWNSTSADFCLEWLRNLLSYSLQSNKLPKIWKIAKVVAVPKPNKPADALGSYHPINLLCVSYKLFERLIYNRIKQPDSNQIAAP